MTERLHFLFFLNTYVSPAFYAFFFFFWNVLFYIGLERKVLVAQLCPTLWDYLDLQPTRFLCPWNSLGKNTGVGCNSLLQGIFPTQGSNLGLLHFRQILYHLNPQSQLIMLWDIYMDLFSSSQQMLTNQWSAVDFHGLLQPGTGNTLSCPKCGRSWGTGARLLSWKVVRPVRKTQADSQSCLTIHFAVFSNLPTLLCNRGSRGSERLSQFPKIPQLARRLKARSQANQLSV